MVYISEYPYGFHRMDTGQGAISTGANFWTEYLIPIMDKETDQEKSLDQYIMWVRTEYG